MENSPEFFEVGVSDFPYQNNRDLWSAAVNPGSRTSRTKKIALHEKWPSSFVYQPKSREFVLEVREGLNFAVWGSENFLGRRKYFLVGCAHMVLDTPICSASGPHRDLVGPQLQKIREQNPLGQSAPKSYRGFPATYIFIKKLSERDLLAQK